MTQIANDKRMRFVFFGYDFMLPGVEHLLADGHELIGIFTFPCDGVFNFNTQTIALANKLKIPVTDQKPRKSDIELFQEKGCECFLSAGYPFKIPPVTKNGAFGINLHPSLLPLGRGLMPTPYIIIDHPAASGMTIHKLSPEFDQGDILHQMELPLHERETVETLSARIALHAPGMLSMVMKELSHYWENAKPQNKKKALYFPPPSEDMRKLDWNLPVLRIDKVARAFGRYGSLALFDDKTWIVYAHDVWEEKHLMAPGTVAARTSREIVMAAKDGFVCVKDFYPAA